MSRRTLNLTDPLYEYLLDHSLREHDTLRRLREKTASMPMARMQISPEQGQFMALLVKLTGARKTLEIGVFTGYSALVVALALPADGVVTGCDISDEWTSVGRPFWKEAGVEHKIDLKLAPALETTKALLDSGAAGSYDFAFIDAHKPEYIAYYEDTLKLLRPGGLVAVDNVLWSGRVADFRERDHDTACLREFNAKVHRDSRVDISMLPIGDGLTLARKK